LNRKGFRSSPPGSARAAFNASSLTFNPEGSIGSACLSFAAELDDVGVGAADADSVGHI
jgi:hypothetical protein